VWVILHHLTGRGMMLDAWSSSLPGAVDRLIRGGYLAVSIFFILSGFVLMRSYGSMEWNRAGLRKYAAARFARIYPVYILSLLVVGPFIVAERLPPAGGPLFEDKTSLLANYLLLLQGWTGTLRVGWNTPAWSLSCEMFFYLCFPLALWMVRPMGWRGAAGMGAAAFAVTEVMLRTGVPYTWKPLLHLPDFVMGLVAARAYELLLTRPRTPAGQGHWLYLPAVTAVAGLIAWPGVLHDLVELNTPLRVLNAIALLGFAFGGGALARVLSKGWAVFLGQASYAMYILHVPVLWWYSQWRGKALASLSSTQAGFVYVGAVVAISAVVFRLVEEPLSRRLRRRLAA
jgi:peptidoglycan/LPS O-acetylase OafA/YrhL